MSSKYREVDGDLIKMALEANFDAIAHGCNCFCTMKAGIAVQMAKVFGCDRFEGEGLAQRGNIGKLGCIDWEFIPIPGHPDNPLAVINCYTQYHYGKNHPDGVEKPLDYAALELCLKKINHLFKGARIGLPQIGCGLAGGDWNVVKQLIQTHLSDCDVTIVNY